MKFVKQFISLNEMHRLSLNKYTLEESIKNLENTFKFNYHKLVLQWMKDILSQ